MTSRPQLRSGRALATWSGFVSRFHVAVSGRACLVALLVWSPLGAHAAAPAPRADAAPASAQAPTREQREVAGALLDQVAATENPLVPGEWVTYRVSGGPGREAFWRIAVVGRELDAKGREARWVEFDIGQHPNLISPVAQMRMLMTQVPGRWEITRFFMGFGAAKPSEVEPSDVARWGGPQQAATAPGPQASAQVRAQIRVVRGAPQRLMTQAGSVLAHPVDVFYRGTPVRRIWTSPDVPVVGLVKIELPGTGHVMEVRDHGIDARSLMVLPHPDAPRISLEAPDTITGPTAPREEEPTP